MNTLFILLGIALFPFILEFTDALKCYHCNGMQTCAINEGKIRQCGQLVKVCQQNIFKGEITIRKCGPEGDPSTKEANPNTCTKKRAIDLCYCSEELCNGELPSCKIRKNKDEACQD